MVLVRMHSQGTETLQSCGLHYQMQGMSLKLSCHMNIRQFILQTGFSWEWYPADITAVHHSKARSPNFSVNQ